jgi:beta-alanine degradation protein BauB
MSDNPRAAWSRELQDAYQAGKWNGAVGSVLVSETPKLRIWHLHIPAGGWFGFHRHVLSHFWTSMADGRSRNYFEDGSTAERILYKGFTQHRELKPKEYLVHAVHNIGGTDLSFTTVEFLDGTNEPLPIPDSLRLKQPA